MGGLGVVVVLLLLSALAAWLKLRPTPGERRRAALRDEAIRSGLRVRWLPAAEAAGLGLVAPGQAAPAACWYLLPAGEPRAGAGVQVRRGDDWVLLEGTAVVLPPLPREVLAVRRDADGVALLWTEEGAAGAGAVAGWLRDLSAAVPAAAPPAAGR